MSGRLTDLPTLVLASGSPRRRAILEGLGIAPVVRPADVDETVLPGEDAETYVVRLAREKARARCETGELVLAADTSVVAPDGEILGKPTDPDDARAMLRRLADTEHRVLSGLALARAGEPLLARSDTTIVTFAPMGDEEIDWYVETGEPADKAGAYGIQGLGGLFVARVEGSYSNVVGLPVRAVYELFAEAGFDLKSFQDGISTERRE